jgi:hypothetical protein
MKQAQETKSTHTQGEWEVTDPKGLYGYGIVSKSGKRDKQGKRLRIASCHFENEWHDNVLGNGRTMDEVRISKDESLANAKLIASAPDLLQALITIVQGCNDDNGFSSLAAIEAIAQQAINKATN